MKKYTPKEWMFMATNLHTLISAEIEKTKNSQSLGTMYPKLVIMYEFFRLIRGEAFIDFRESMEELDLQKELYKMEDDIKNQLESLYEKLSQDSARIQFNLDQMKKSFDIDHFK